MTLSITIDRTSLSLADLVLGGQDGTGGLLAITDYTEPATQARINYAPESDFVHGSLALGYTWQQTLLSFEVAPFGPTGEQETRTAVAALVAAVSQFPAYEVTVTVGNAAPETWQCDPGSVVPGGARTYVDLRDSDPFWRVSIPCYPIRSVA